MSRPADGALVEAARDLEWILCDVDGVLTDGSLYYGRDGEEFKRFDVKDGLALKLAQRDGLKVGLLSGRASAALSRRAEELGLDEVISGRQDKAVALGEFLERHGTLPARLAFIGDDLPDLPVLRAVTLSFAPADAAPEVRAAVRCVLKRPGGHGTVREMVEWLLRARGSWETILAPFTGRV